MCVCITIYEYLLLLLSMVCWVCLWVCIIKGCVSTYAYTSLCYFLWTHLCTWTGHNFTSNDKISLKPKWIHCTSKLSQLFVTSQFYSGLKTNIVTNTPHFIKSQEHKMQITKYKLSFNLLSCSTLPLGGKFCLQNIYLTHLALPVPNNKPNSKSCPRIMNRQNASDTLR